MDNPYKITTGTMARKAVLAYLWSIAEAGVAHAPISEICEATEAHEHTVAAALSDLTRAGHLEVVGSKLKGPKRARLYMLLTRESAGD